MPMAALILGICGIVPFLGMGLGLAGVVVGIIALTKGVERKGLAVGGIITGLVLPSITTVALLIAILIPSLSRARESARRTMCEANLHGIFLGLTMYQAENMDVYPADLDVLVAQRLVPEETLRCPSAEANRRCDYFFYLPPAKLLDEMADVSGVVIACDLAGNHRGDGRNVLYLYGNVEVMNEADFQAALADPVNAAFAAALRAAEGGPRAGP